MVSRHSVVVGAKGRRYVYASVVSVTDDVVNVQSSLIRAVVHLLFFRGFDVFCSVFSSLLCVEVLISGFGAH